MNSLIKRVGGINMFSLRDMLSGTWKTRMLEGETPAFPLTIRSDVGLWYGYELYQAISVGYTLIATVLKEESSSMLPSCEVVKITTPDILTKISSFRYLFLPRYIHYKNDVYMHIEKFQLMDMLYGIDKGPKLTLEEVHKKFYEQGKMTNAIYDKLMKNIK